MLSVPIRTLTVYGNEKNFIVLTKDPGINPEGRIFESSFVEKPFLDV